MKEASPNRLGDVASFVRGVTFKPEDVVPVGSIDSVACMRTKNVQAGLDVSDVWGIPERMVRREDQYLRHGDLLVSSANSWNLVGKCCWVPELPWRTTFGGFISVLRGDRSQVEARYLYHWFSSPRIQATVRSFGQQTTNISNLNVSRCLNLQLRLPPLAEQRRIADILDRVEALPVKRQAATTKLSDLRQAFFLETFGDPVTNPNNWPSVSLREVATIDRVIVGAAEIDKGAVYVGLENMQSGGGIIDQREVVPGELASAKFRFTARHVLFGKLRPYLAKVALPSFGGICSTDILPILPGPSVLREYLCYLLLQPQMIEMASRRSTGANLPRLSPAALADFQIVVPPMDTQCEFVAGLERFGTIREGMKSSQAGLDSLFSSLQHRAFRGEL